MKLQRDLLLFQFLTDGLGGEFAALSATLKDTDTGRRADGQSHWFGCLEGRASRLKAPLNTDALRRYDLNILQHEATLADRRSGFQLKYFQYLALLYFEMFLDRLVTDRAQLLLDLEAFRVARFRHQAPVTAGDLGKLAFWMATGSGKTLLLHINYLQFLHYRPFKPTNILLLAPSRGLAEQHLGDLETSGPNKSPCRCWFCPWGAVGALGANQVRFPWRTGGALTDKFRQLSTNNDNNRVLW